MRALRKSIHRTISRVVTATVVVVFAATGDAADIFSNPINDAGNPSTSNPYAAGQASDPNITASGVGRGPSINGNSGQNRYNARDWAASFDAGDYFTFTLTPSAGYEIDFNSLSGVWRRSATGPNSYQLRTSVDGFSGVIASGAITGSASDEDYSLDLSSLQNITSAIEFRFYGWGGTSAAGTFSFNDFVFDGQVNSVSVEPTPFAGDYNDDGSVDAADYVVWRKSMDDQTPLLNETASSGFVDDEDFTAWTANFGAVEAGGGSAARAFNVPEPHSVGLILACLCSVAVAVRGRNSRSNEPIGGAAV